MLWTAQRISVERMILIPEHPEYDSRWPRMERGA
jgi:hypothetical protein